MPETVVVVAVAVQVVAGSVGMRDWSTWSVVTREKRILLEE
jgi:hypothetical protein